MEINTLDQMLLKIKYHELCEVLSTVPSKHPVWLVLINHDIYHVPKLEEAEDTFEP